MGKVSINMETTGDTPLNSARDLADFVIKQMDKVKLEWLHVHTTDNMGGTDQFRWDKSSSE